MGMLARLKITSSSKMQKCKKSLVYFPNIVTFSNAIFGFLSIIKAFEGHFFVAAFFIVIAAVMDLLDGRLARVLGFTSGFGLQLDSLCDAVSFCLAPTILLYSWALSSYGYVPKGFTFSLILYLCCGLGRLAKFNITSTKQHSMFIGLPTTIAAIFVSSLVLYAGWISSHWTKMLLNKNAIMILIMLVASLMVSSIRFFSTKSFKVCIKKDYIKFLLVFIGVLWALLHGYPLLFFLVSAYIFAGISYTICCL